MPCSCDDWNPRTPFIGDSQVEGLEKSLCRARSIIAKLLAEEGAESFSKDLKAKAEEDLTLLAAHKRAEVAQDIAKLTRERKALYEAKRAFESHGGDSSSLTPRLTELDQKILKLKSLTDHQLIYGS